MALEQASGGVDLVVETQNFWPGSAAAPHAAQLIGWASDAAHSRQNFAASRF